MLGTPLNRCAVGRRELGIQLPEYRRKVCLIKHERKDELYQWCVLADNFRPNFYNAGTIRPEDEFESIVTA
jgi:hypothetical protein